MRDVPPDLMHRLKRHGQEHALFGWEELDATQRAALANQLAGIDLAEIDRLYANRDKLSVVPTADRLKPVPTETIDAPRRDGEVAGREDARATSVFSDDRQTPTCLHERPHDGITWGPALTVTLTKVE